MLQLLLVRKKVFFQHVYELIGKMPTSNRTAPDEDMFICLSMSSIRTDKFTKGCRNGWLCFGTVKRSLYWEEVEFKFDFNFVMNSMFATFSINQTFLR